MAIVITKQPENVTAALNSTVTFSVKATGEGLTYQWQFNGPSSGLGWHDSGMTGSNTASISLEATAARNGYQYRCVISDAQGNSLISEAATLTVQAIIITRQPRSYRGPVGLYAVFSVEAEGEGLSYQWQWYGAGAYWGESGLPTAKTTSLVVPATTDSNGQKYRCVITDASGNRAVSDGNAVLVIDDSAPFLVQPESLGAIGDAIRSKTGGADALTPVQMAAAVGTLTKVIEGTVDLEEGVSKLAAGVVYLYHEDV